MVSALASGREVEFLREGAGVVVVTGVADFLPWATEETMGTRWFLCFVATEEVLGSTRVGVGFPDSREVCVGRGGMEKAGDRLSNGCSLVGHDQRDCRRNREYGPSFSPTGKSNRVYASASNENGIDDIGWKYIHEATGTC